MVDIAHLAYQVNSKELKDGSLALDIHAGAARRTEAAAAKFEKQSNRLTLSQRELVAAQRQLPMQFTDIFTSLQAGQNPMQVMLQQGGQLKDTFGGIGPAARAMSGYLMGLVNPLTLAAGAVGGLAIAWNAAEQRNTAFNNAIILTGNYAETTAEKMAALAAEMDSLAGVTEGSASEALAKVAATGRFTAEQFSMVGAAAEQMRASAGVAIDDTIDKFVAIGKDPVDALLKLNEAEHFLTQAQLDRVKALQDLGREQEAVTEGMRIYAREGVSRAKEVEGAMAAMPSLWREIKEGTLESGDAIVNWAGDVDAAFGEALNSLARYRIEQEGLYRKFLDLYFDQGDPFAGVTATVASPAVDTVDSDAAREREQQREAERTFWADGLQYLSEREQLEQRILRMIADGREEGIATDRLRAREAQMRAAFVEKSEQPDGGGARKRVERISEEQQAVDRLLEKFTRKSEVMERQIALYDATGRAAEVAYDIQASGLAKINPELAKQVQALAEWLDFMDEVQTIEAVWAESSNARFDKMAGDAGESFDQMSEFAIQAARNVQSSLGDNLYNVLDGKFDEIGDSFANMIKRMLAEAAAAKMLEAFGTWATGYTGAGSGFINALGGALQGGGGREYGGSVYQGGMYQIGERNKPELLSTPNGQYLIPGDNGRVDPVRAVAAVRCGGGDMQVVVNNHVGGQVNKREETRSMPDGSVMRRVVIDIIADSLNGGAIGALGKARYGWRDQV